MDIILKCNGDQDSNGEGEHDIEMYLPDSLFDGGPLIIPCPECGKKYLISKDKPPELFEREPIRFPAMHY